MKIIMIEGLKVTFDDLQVQELDKVDRSVFYKCTGFDELGRQYEGVCEYCCDDLEGITDIQMISYMWHNKKPYQARARLKSINFWQSVINGDLEPKKPMNYYKNKLSYYTESDIEYLKKLAS